jgi:hypothetical protein
MLLIRKGSMMVLTGMLFYVFLPGHTNTPERKSAWSGTARTGENSLASELSQGFKRVSRTFGVAVYVPRWSPAAREGRVAVAQ